MRQTPQGASDGQGKNLQSRRPGTDAIVGDAKQMMPGLRTPGVHGVHFAVLLGKYPFRCPFQKDTKGH